MTHSKSAPVVEWLGPATENLQSPVSFVKVAPATACPRTAVSWVIVVLSPLSVVYLALYPVCIQHGKLATVS